MKTLTELLSQRFNRSEHQTGSKQRSGFTLFEILVTLGIVLILSSITYPSYQMYTLRIEQHRAKVALLDLAYQLERYFGQHQTYEDATLDKLNVPQYTPDQHYELQISQNDQRHYQIQAFPKSLLTRKDTVCRAFQLDETGKQSVSGRGSAAQCWR